MLPFFFLADGFDHCRIGSLEMDAGGNAIPSDDHCRIGSLEIHRIDFHSELFDHCRIGSLENVSPNQTMM